MSAILSVRGARAFLVAAFLMAVTLIFTLRDGYHFRTSRVDNAAPKEQPDSENPQLPELK